MKTILTESQSIRDAVNQLKNQIITLAVSNKRSGKNFPGGVSTKGNEYSIPCSLGSLFVMIPDNDWNERIPLFFTLNPKTSDFITDIEIYLPLCLDRSVGWCLVMDNTEILICNRGRFTSFKSAIPYKTSLTFFRDSVISVDDSGKDAGVISIANLKSPDCIEQIALFVKKIKVLKRRIKIEAQNKSLPF